MLKIGITGGIGSGKTTVSNMLRNLGVPVFNSDLAARKLLDTDETLKTEIKKSFDADMYTSENLLDRERMANLVFNDRVQLDKINNLVHPLVREAFNLFCDRHSKSPYVLKEAAILFESGTYQSLDKVITVFCPKETRISRIEKRDDTTRSKIEKRMRSQYSDEERNSMADFIIINDGVEDLLPQVMNLHNLFLNENAADKKIF